MCTLTWVHGAPSSGGATGGPSVTSGTGGAAEKPTSESPAGGEPGYRLWFNRDERLVRGPEIPPGVAMTDGTRYIAPADTDAGGTWIAANEHGITVCILNGYVESRGAPREEWTSRGHLVRELADLARPLDLWRRLPPRDLDRYRPFVFVVVAPEPPALVARWDGLDLVVDGQGERQLPIVSSSYEQDQVQRARRALYKTLVTDSGGPSPERLEAFQNHAGPHGPDAWSPSMQREDAATRSQCRIEVTPAEVRFTFVPGPPHATSPAEPVVLARRMRR